MVAVPPKRLEPPLCRKRGPPTRFHLSVLGEQTWPAGAFSILRVCAISGVLITFSSSSCKSRVSRNIDSDKTPSSSGHTTKGNEVSRLWPRAVTQLTGDGKAFAPSAQTACGGWIPFCERNAELTRVQKSSAKRAAHRLLEIECWTDLNASAS